MTRKIVELDVRDILRGKQDPFAQIMEAVSSLEPDDILELHATFRPEPLLGVLGKQGFAHAVRVLEPEHVVVQFYRGQTDLPMFHLDNRGLEPPQPMVRTLAILDQEETCKNGELGLEIWNERVPAILLPELTERGYNYEIRDEESNPVRILIWHEKE